MPPGELKENWKLMTGISVFSFVKQWALFSKVLAQKQIFANVYCSFEVFISIY